MRFLLVLYFFLIGIYSQSVWAIQSDATNTIKARSFEKKGRAFFNEAEYDSSYVYYESAVALYE